jgi:hypothetical protein
MREVHLARHGAIHLLYRHAGLDKDHKSTVIVWTRVAIDVLARRAADADCAICTYSKRYKFGSYFGNIYSPGIDGIDLHLVELFTLISRHQC